MTELRQKKWPKIIIKDIITKESIIGKTLVLKISPNPSLPKRGNSSLWKREGGRDFVNQCRYYYGLISNYECESKSLVWILFSGPDHVADAFPERGHGSLLASLGLPGGFFRLDPGHHALSWGKRSGATRTAGQRRPHSRKADRGKSDHALRQPGFYRPHPDPRA